MKNLSKLSTAGVLNLLVPAYPQIKIVPLRVPPNQNYMPFAYPQIRTICPSRTPKSKILPKRASFERFYKFCVPPETFSRTPRGTRTPGWEPLGLYSIKLAIIFVYSRSPAFLARQNFRSYRRRIHCQGIDRQKKSLKFFLQLLILTRASKEIVIVCQPT